MRAFSLYSMVILYVAAGINHFLNPGVYLSIMPPWVPYHQFCVEASGVAEVLFGLLLIPVTTRPIAAWLIIVLLIAIFPANVQMTLDHYHRHDLQTWLTVLRLPLQLVLILWAAQFRKRSQGVESALI